MRNSERSYGIFYGGKVRNCQRICGVLRGKVRKGQFSTEKWTVGDFLVFGNRESVLCGVIDGGECGSVFRGRFDWQFTREGMNFD